MVTLLLALPKSQSGSSLQAHIINAPMIRMTISRIFIVRNSFEILLSYWPLRY